MTLDQLAAISVLVIAFLLYVGVNVEGFRTGKGYYAAPIFLLSTGVGFYLISIVFPYLR